MAIKLLVSPEPDLEDSQIEVFELNTGLPPNSGPAGGNTSCVDCKFFVNGKTLLDNQDELASVPIFGLTDQGRNVGICAYSGSLVEYATSAICWYRQNRDHGHDESHVLASLKFTDSMKSAIDETSAATIVENVVSTIPEPSIRESDKEFGIVEFFPVDTPPDANNVEYAPRFDSSVFKASLLEKFETQAQRDMSFFVDYDHITHEVVGNHQDGFATRLIGPAGVGKTDFALYFAQLMNLPLTEIRCKPEMEDRDVVGLPTLKVDEYGNSYMTWAHAPFGEAYENPGVILIDEPNTAPSHIAVGFRSALDGRKSVSFITDEGEVTFHQHPWCFIISAENPPWDPRYMGANYQSEADMQRMYTKEIGFPPRYLEEEILRNICAAKGYEIPQETLDLVLNIGDDLRNGSNPALNGRLEITWGVRTSSMLALATRRWKIRKALAVTVTDRIEPSQRKILEETVNTWII